jgi:hypothetical protein
MKKIILSSAIALICSTGTVNAALFHFDGNIANHNDVVTVSFSLANDATNVRLWTDSFHSGANFDPITALWNETTGQLISENDDDPSIAPGQTSYDSGFSLPSLLAGNYFFTVATYNNFASGTNIANGFNFDAQSPISLALWNQPSSNLNMGTFWSVNIDGVDAATTVSAVPVPAAIWLFGSAIAGFVGASRRKSAAV